MEKYHCTADELAERLGDSGNLTEIEAYLNMEATRQKIAAMADDERAKYFQGQRILARNANETYDDWWEGQFAPDNAPEAPPEDA